LGRVLVVEDNAVNQLVAEGVLRSLGYDVELAENGLVALDALAGQDYAVVLMDCHMPEMDGFEATAELRRREGTARRTPVVAMTAGVLAEDRARCTAAGMDDFVAKPVDVQLLAAVLARWMTTASGAAPSSGVRDGADVVNPDALDVLDTGRLDVLRRLGANDGWGVLPAVAEAFLRTAPGEWDGLRDAGHAGDAAEAQSRLHRMRGAAANLGALQLAATCEALENALRSGAPVDADLLDQVRTDSGRACDALAAVLAGRT
jgi:CheY-like chemotaxis protein